MHAKNRVLSIAGLAVMTLLCFVFIYTFMPDTHVFQNKVDGYAITLPKSMQVLNAESSVRTVYAGEHVTLSIYFEPCETEEDKLVYVGYSNRFLQNTQDFNVLQNEVVSLGDYSATLSRWDRMLLSRVENDKNHYACYDIDAKTDGIYTLFFKYDDTVNFETEIVPMAESFVTCPVTMRAENTKVGQSAAPRLNSEAQAVYEELFSEKAPLTWGLYSHYTVHDHAVVDNLEQKLEYCFDVYLLYSNFGETPYLNGESVYDALCLSCPEDQIPELTLQTVDDNRGNMLLRTLDGEFDVFLHAYAKEVAAYGRPVLFRLANEMNGDWCVYCAFHYCRDPDLYVAFYRYVFDVFQQENADNVIWVWNPNHRSFPDFKWNNEILYYPGDAYVNVVGLTAYNTGNYYEGEYWSSFEELYSELYNRTLAQYAQPMMITEFASSSVGGDKAAWISDMFENIADYSRIKVAVWWNGCDMDNSGGEPVPARPYYLDETPETTEAFKQGIHSVDD